MKIIACLGNPGRKYKKNRHNAGFIIGHYLVKKLRIKTGKKSFNAESGRGKAWGNDVLILFPDTFMNKSGISVKAALQYYGVSPENLIVIHDEIELPFGDYRIKFGGGHKGHNGLRSIIQENGTADFHRVRIGVGRPENNERAVADYVLSDFSKDELNRLLEDAPEITGIIKNIITEQEGD